MSKLRKGTSIIEAVIAIALIGIILLWSVTAYTNISKQSKTSEDVEIASTLASKQIEYIKTLNYNDLKNNIKESTSVNLFDDHPYDDRYGYKYANVSEQGVTGSPVYLKTITIEIYKMTDTTTPLIKMDCNFLRSKSDGTNAGI